MAARHLRGLGGRWVAGVILGLLGPVWPAAGGYEPVSPYSPAAVDRMLSAAPAQVGSESADQPPHVIYSVQPRYPWAYAEKGVRGSVVVDFFVLPDGTVAGARAVESPDPRLAQAAEAAVMQWLFQPGFKHGRPVVTHVQIPIVFAGLPADAPTDPAEAAGEARARGEDALARHDFLGAMAAFAAALRLTPDSADAVYDRGLARQGLGENHLARADFAAAVRLDPDDVRFHLSRGQVDFLLKDYASAVADADETVALAPDTAAGYVLRGQAYAALGRDDEALDDFGQALALDPVQPDALAGQRLIRGRRAALAPRERAWDELRYQTFELVWRTVNEAYYDPAFGGVDWKAVREKYRVRLAQVPDNAHLRWLLCAMLAELKRTHFEILPREGAVFNPAERVRIGTAGVEVAPVDGGVAVTEVRPGSAGAAAGLRPGDLVTRVDTVVIAGAMQALVKAGIPAAKRGAYLSDFVQSRLEGPVGSKVRLGLTGSGGAAREATVTCRTNDAVWSEPAGRFPSLPIRCEATRGEDGIATLRFNTFALPVMKTARSLLRSLRPGDGLIVDLRGNGGGVSLIAQGISGWLCDQEFSLGEINSRGGTSSLDVYPQEGAFLGPVAILIDGRSASTSEILAAGLGETGHARIFGEHSAGAALPSFFKSLPTGDLLQYAVADVTTPRQAVLEGTGVTPDEVVVRTRADLAAGRDPVVMAARLWLDAARNQP